MKYFKLLLLTIFFFSCDSGTSEQQSKNENQEAETIYYKDEIIDGPANIRDKKNGIVELSLNDGVAVDLGLMKDNWYEIGIWIDNKGYQGFIPANEKIYSKGKWIGTTKSKIEPMFADEESFYYAGYTFKDNIKKESLLENQVFTLIAQNHTKTEFLPKLKKLGFEEIDVFNHDDFVFYGVYEDFVVDPSPLDRLSIIFKNNKFIGIKSSRDFNFREGHFFKLERGFTLNLIPDYENGAELKDKINAVLGQID
ncbi:hypothetical protein MY04_2113 [Flammeovirga sp. MY04]|uniref:hypothetical protein n=1 Tax=Flammeovirga sp. MY04 TaxID=1191459 RepID=UPI0008061DBA|nr:hypothetical protein [Flammeovirga sp. MY04]ANQ49487.1 hypothetical protein MY04_2113 [Flammeovirga sp. MY04]